MTLRFRYFQSFLLLLMFSTSTGNGAPSEPNINVSTERPQKTSLIQNMDLYSEGGYLSREELYILSARVRGDFNNQSILNLVFHPYIQGGEEWTYHTSEKAQDTLNHHYLSLGLMSKWKGFALSSEGRFRYYYGPNTSLQEERSIADLRILITYGKYFEYSWGYKKRIFHEIYGESLYSSDQEHNIIASGFYRGGIRSTAVQWENSSLLLDGYLEPYMSLDRIGHFYNNRIELRPSIRATFWHPKVSSSLAVSALSPVVYLPRSNGNVLPKSLKEKLNGYRILATIGGTF